ncbi:MAG TPA: toprim domain-containing protein [Bacteroides reticulotermitis]|nr:toprim domain-containing protein [Bacteroides reticulotermitis]
MITYSEANQISIKAYLASKGIHSVKDYGYYGMYHSPLREDSNASLKVDYNKNLWHDFGNNDGGTMIDLAMRIHHCSLKEAMMELNRYNSTSVNQYNNTTVQQQSDSFSFQGNKSNNNAPTIMIQKILPITNKALIDYLTERKINIDIAKEHCQEVYYSVNDKQYFALGLKNDSGGYELRNKYFKGCTSKDISTSNNENEACLVFEGFMDYLSYLTLKNTARPQVDVVILNSIANLPKALKFIESHSNVSTYLDNDEAGRKATHIINNTCKSHIDKSTEYTKYKDLNEYLCNKKLAEKEELKRKPLRGFRH